MQPAQSAAKVTVNGRHHFSFHQRLTQGAAGFKRRIVGRVAAGDALAHKVQPRVAAVLLPAAHPLAVAPAVGAEQRHAFAAEAAAVMPSTTAFAMASVLPVPLQ